MVLSEYFSSTNAWATVLLISKNTFQFAPMWAAIVLIGLLGYLLNRSSFMPRPRAGPRSGTGAGRAATGAD
jgi:ABC-type nitrate/sulfonate/bicarbonate transport system permease component